MLNFEHSWCFCLHQKYHRYFFKSSQLTLCTRTLRWNFMKGWQNKQLTINKWFKDQQQPLTFGFGLATLELISRPLLGVGGVLTGDAVITTFVGVVGIIFWGVVGTFLGVLWSAFNGDWGRGYMCEVKGQFHVGSACSGIQSEINIG